MSQQNRFSEEQIIQILRQAHPFEPEALDKDQITACNALHL